MCAAICSKFPILPKGEILKKKMWMNNMKCENLVIKRSKSVRRTHFVSADVFQGGRWSLKESTVPLLFAWNDYSLSAARPCVWKRKERAEDEE